MENEANVDDLIDRWEELRDQGTPPTIEELCADRPELAAEVRRRIEALRAMDSALDSEVRAPRATTAAHGGRGAELDRGLPEVLLATAVYRPMSHHDQGGLGVVFTAHQEELDRTVALKRIRPDRLHDVARRRFLREAALTARLQHPGIVPVYGLGQDEGEPFYTMPFIAGRTLQEAIEAFHGDDSLRRDPDLRSLRLRGLLQHFVAACNTMAYAQDQGVVHRDLKPSNIMLGPYGETLVMDWGLAKRLRADGAATEEEGELVSPDPSSEDVTAAGDVVGTPMYMSPEQARGEPAGPAGDIFSLGLVLYAILTGRSAFEKLSGRGADRLQAVRDAAIVPPRRRDPGLPRALEAVCLKALAARPEDRYASACALADDVQKWLADEPVTAWRDPVSVRARRWMRRHRTLVASTATVLVLSVVGLAGFTTILAGKNEELAARGRALDVKNTELASKNEELDRQRRRAEAREGLALAAVKKFRDAVTANAQLKNQPGLDPLRRALLKEPLEFFRTLRDQLQADRDTSPDALVKLATAGFDLAETTLQFGNIPDALRAHCEALAIREQLDRDYPTVAEYQAELAGSHNALGMMRTNMGHPAEALKSYRRALAIMNRVTRDSHSVSEYQRDLARVHNNIGELLGNMGQSAEALQSYRSAVAIFVRLVGDQPAVTQYQAALAWGYNNIGALLCDAGQPVEAREPHAKALEIRERLVRDYPAIDEYQQDLAVSHYNIGKMLDMTGHQPEALKSYRRSLEIRERLARDNPFATLCQSELAACITNIGDLLKRAGNAAEALESHLRSLEIWERLARDNPKIHYYQGCLGYTLQNIAEIEIGQRQWRQAEVRLERAIKHQKAALAAMPGQPFYHEVLRLHLLTLTKVHQALNQPAEAIRVTRELEALAPNNPSDLYDIACAWALTVPISRGEQQQALAAEAVRR